VTSGIRLLKLETIRQININQTIKYFAHHPSDHSSDAYVLENETLALVICQKVKSYRFAHCKCKRVMQHLSRLSSVCLSRVRFRKLSKTGAKFRRLYIKSGSPSKNMTSDLALKVAKYPKISHKPPNSAK